MPCDTHLSTSGEGRALRLAKSLDDVLSAFMPEQRAQVDARAQELIEEALTRRDLRQAHHLTQERMAALLSVEQENVSRIEWRADLLLSTLASYVAAIGGELQLIAAFPNHKPVMVALGDLSESALVKPWRRNRRDAKAQPAT